MTNENFQSLPRCRNASQPTRRDFVKTSALVAGAGLAAASVGSPILAAAGGQSQAQVGGSRANTFLGYVAFQDENRISIFTLDKATGKLDWQEHVKVDGGPAPLAVDPARKFLYVGHRGTHELSSYRIDPRTGGLSLIGTIPLQGEPISVATDRTGRFLLSVYFYQSTVAVHSVSNDGVIAFPPVEWRHSYHGPHGIVADRSNRFVFVPHTADRGGPNAIYQYKFDQNTGRLTPNVPPRVTLKEYLGPRHVCLHPTLDVLYSSDEQGSSTTAYAIDSSAGTLTPFQTITTLPQNFTARNTPSEVLITPSGKFLYVANRGHNSIAGFTVDPSTGRLAANGWAATEPGPRTFSLDPQGTFVIVSGQQSGKVASYRINQETGTLTPLQVYEGGKNPMWTLITSLPG
jgi:6-phosphogluconolactonase